MAALWLWKTAFKPQKTRRNTQEKQGLKGEYTANVSLGNKESRRAKRQENKRLISSLIYP
jgi:hypothetical protein